jgi:hypothetical protein
VLSPKAPYSIRNYFDPYGPEADPTVILRLVLRIHAVCVSRRGAGTSLPRGVWVGTAADHPDATGLLYLC